MTSNRRKLAVIVCSAALVLFGACAPEGQRERGGDVGGDIRNLGDSINMHGEHDANERMFYQTPHMGQGIERSRDARADDEES
jgi:hypothetical protein